MNVIELSLDSIRPYENNPRDNTEAIDKVAESIKEFGFQQPIVVDSEKVIIVGHTRYEAAKKLAMETVPVVIASELSPEKAKAYRLADNKVAEFSQWDWEKLANEFKGLKFSDVNFNNLGFDYDFDFGDTDEADVNDDFEASETDENGNVGNIESSGSGNDGGNGNTEEFAQIDEGIKTQHRCPMCGYEW